MVRYRNPGTQVFEDSEHESVNADNAVVGTGTNPPLLENGRVDPELTVRPNGGDLTGSAAIYPSGSDNRSHLLVANDSDYDNYGGVKWEVEGLIADIEAFSKGSGVVPTGLRIAGFSDGILDNAPGGGQNPTRQRTVTDGDYDMIENAAITNVLADGTLTTIGERSTWVGGLFVVSATDDGTNRISDLVHFGINNPTVVSGKVLGSVTRSDISYDFNGSELQMSINMSGTWTVSCKGIGGL
jgi:hypothetical protein